MTTPVFDMSSYDDSLADKLIYLHRDGRAPMLSLLKVYHSVTQLEFHTVPLFFEHTCAHKRVASYMLQFFNLPANFGETSAMS